MSRRLLSIDLILLISLLIGLSCSNSSEPEPLNNKVYLPENTTVAAGDHFTLPLRFANKEPLGGLVVPLSYSGDHIRCDSVSFVGSRVGNYLFAIGGVDTVVQTITIVIVDTTIVASRGLLANLHFWAFGNSPEVDIEIDTTRTSHGEGLSYADTSVQALLSVPEFIAGKVHVQTQLPDTT